MFSFGYRRYVVLATATAAVSSVLIAGGSSAQTTRSVRPATIEEGVPYDPAKAPKVDYSKVKVPGPNSGKAVVTDRDASLRDGVVRSTSISPIGSSADDVTPTLTESAAGFQASIGDAGVAVASNAGADELVSVTRKQKRVSVGKASASGFDRVSGKKDPVEADAVFADGVKSKRNAGKSLQVDFDAPFGPGTQLTYEVLSEGVKESIVLAQPPKRAPVFRFDLSAKGLVPKAVDGGWEFADDVSGEVLFRVPASFMFDSRGGANTPGNAYAGVDQQLVKKGDNWLLVLRPSVAWLKSKARVYPVTIDPTIYTQAVNPMNLGYMPWGDNSVGTTFSAYTNDLLFGNWWSSNWRSYVKFDPNLFVGKQILSATLRLPVVNCDNQANSAAPYANPVRARMLTSAYSYGMAWPGPSFTGDVSSPVSGWGTSSTFDVTAFAQQWGAAPGSNFGLMFDMGTAAGYCRARQTNGTQVLTIDLVYNDLVTTTTTTPPTTTTTTSPDRPNSNAQVLAANIALQPGVYLENWGTPARFRFWMKRSGDLVVYDVLKNVELWRLSDQPNQYAYLRPTQYVTPVPGSWAVLQGSGGNFVVYDPAGNPLWYSGDSFLTSTWQTRLWFDVHLHPYDSLSYQVLPRIQELNPATGVWSDMPSGYNGWHRTVLIDNIPTTVATTTTVPPPTLPNFADNTATFIKNYDLTSCLSVDDAENVVVGVCDEVWVPRLVPGGYVFERAFGSGQCLGSVGTALKLQACSTDSSRVWREGFRASPSFSTLILSSTLTTNPQCITKTATLAPCGTSNDQQWADDLTNWCILSTVPCAGRIPAPSYLTDREKALWDEGQDSILQPLAGSFWSELWKVWDLDPLCAVSRYLCFGDAFKYVNFLHKLVQYDLASRVGGDLECPIPASRDRMDVCTSTHVGEVKYDFGPTVLLGGGQVLDYARRSGRVVANGSFWPAAAPPRAIALGNLGSLNYRMTSTNGVWAYKPSLIAPRLQFQVELSGETASTLAAQYYLKLFPKLEPAVTAATNVKAMVKAMRSVGYSTYAVAFTAKQRFGTSIANGVLFVAGGTAIAGLMWFIVESIVAGWAIGT